MDVANEQIVLRCRLCNKPFDKQSTLKRHGYYCRSRKVGGTVRTRSCLACARGKAGCDNRRPRCSRCATKAIECHYPPNAPRPTGPRTQHGDNIPAEGRRKTLSSAADSAGVEDRREASIGDDMIINDERILPDPDFADMGADYLDWHDPEVEFADFLNPEANVSRPSPGSSSLFHHSTALTDETAQVQQGLSFPTFPIPAAPTQAVRSLVQRPRMQTSAQRIANLILSTLKSYPLMMMSNNILPPFIHPSLVFSDVDDANMEPLTNCISLVHMISSDVRGSRKLFWKNVRLECEYLSEEHPKLSKWELLAAMQALSIYILIRLDEGETDYNNFDFLLIRTFVAIAQQLTKLDIECHTRCALCNKGLEFSWKEWIFRESRRRLAVVYRVVNMLIYFEPAAMCNMPTDLILAPLPAKKKLWEADDEVSWKAESQRGPGVQTAFGLAADGELVKLDEGWLSCSDTWLPARPSDAKNPSTSTARWEEWCSGIDGLGGLVLLAASLIV